MRALALGPRGLGIVALVVALIVAPWLLCVVSAEEVSVDSAAPAPGDVLGVTVAEPAQPLVAPAPLVDLLKSVESDGKRAASATDLSGKVIAYRGAIETLDQIDLYYQDAKIPFDRRTLLVDFMRALDEERVHLKGDARLRNLAEARATVLRLPDPADRATRLLEISQVEVAQGNRPAALATIHSAIPDALRLPAGDRDATLAKFVDLAVVISDEGRVAARVWLMDIADPKVLSSAMRSITAATVGKSRNVEDTGDAPGATVDDRLFNLADGLVRLGRFDEATLAIMSVSDKVSADRDEAMALLVEDMIRSNVEPQSILAFHGIGLSALRSRTLLDMVRYATARRRLSAAWHFAELIETTPEALAAWTEIGVWHLERGYRAQAARAADTAGAAAAKMPRGLTHDVLIAALSGLRADLGDYAEARSLIARISDTGRLDAARAYLSGSAAKAYDLDNAVRSLRRLPPGGARDTASVAYATALARRNRIDDARAVVDKITGDLPKLTALASVIRVAGAGAATGTTVDPLWPAEARQLARRVRLGAGLGDAKALLAMVEARSGAFSAARAALAEATNSSHFSTALANVVELEADIAGAAAADSTAMLAIDGASAQRAQSALAIGLARRGDTMDAVARTRGIVDDKLRVRTFRRVAEIAAKDADLYEVLGKRMKKPKSNAAAALDPNARLIATEGLDLYSIPNSALGDVIPGIPDTDRYTTAAVASKIPPVRPVSMHVAPLQYSDFNRKFITSLTSLFNEYGGRLFLYDAQSTAFPVFLYLENGVYDLPAVAQYLRSTGESHYLEQQGRTFTLRLPLLVGTNATLIISGADVDELRLSGTTGAYLVNAGKLFLYDSKVVGWDEKKAAPAEVDYDDRLTFRSFMTSWSGSDTQIAQSRIMYLGIRRGKGYGFTLSSGPKDLMDKQAAGLRRPIGTIVESTFGHMLYGFYSYEADDVALIGNEYVDNKVYGIDPHDRSRRLLIAYNTAYRSHHKHGIIVSREVNDSWIVGNISFENGGSGFMLDRNSRGNVVYANQAFHNAQDGMSVFESPCNIVASNNFSHNARDGVKLRNSWDIGVFRNKIADNGRLALSSYIADITVGEAGEQRDFVLDPYSQFGDAAVVGNVMARNGSGGVSMTGMSSLAWKGNVFAEQKKPLGGELMVVREPIIQRSNQGVFVRSQCVKPVEAQSCPLKHSGFLTGLGLYDDFADRTDATCPAHPVGAGSASTESMQQATDMVSIAKGDEPVGLEELGAEKP